MTPDTWQTSTLGKAGEWLSGGTPSKSRKDYWVGRIPWVSPKDMKRFLLDDTEDHVSEIAASNGTRVVPAGTVFIVVRGMILAHTFPVCVAQRAMAFNQDVKAIVPNGAVDGAFLAHWLHGRSDALLRLVSEATHGTKRIEQAELQAYPIALPAPPEQHEIARLLDLVDATVRNTEQIIAKLGQVKRGLLHDLLTRGIDHNGLVRDPERHPEQFKDSPLGRIAREWDAGVLDDLLDGIDAGTSPSCPDRPAVGDEWGVLKVSAVRPIGFQPSENKAITNPAHVNAAFEVRDGDLLITRANTPELVGLTCLVDRPPPRLLLCDKTLRLNIAGSADRRFVFYVSQMPYVRRQIEMHATGSSGSMKNIGQATIRNLRLKVPPPPERAAIATILSRHDDRVVAEMQRASKLRLLKLGLAEDLLTGRVRVAALAKGAAE